MTQIYETALSQLIETVHRLRAPNGCPWDRAQTHQSLRQYLIEEAYEVLDVLDQIHTSEDLKNEKIRNSFQEELGDLLMQVLLHSEMTQELGIFNIGDVAKALNDKLIRRHPHVFGEVKVESADVALQQWEKQKAKEKKTQPQSSVLEGVPKNLPALQRASRVLEKVTKVGFQWNDMGGPLAKLEEELQELKAEILNLEELEKLKTSAPDANGLTLARKKVESELGDVFFTLCNLAYLLKLTPEDALRSTLKRFEIRFRHVEQRLKDLGKTPEDSNLSEMDTFWNEAKNIEKCEVWGLTGGIGSGKSTAARFFAQLGIPTVDADQIAKEISSENGPAHSAIVQRFGTSDRAKIKEIIFSDAQAKKDLEAILHPLIQRESLARIKACSQKHRIVLYEASLLIETGRYKDLSGLIVVEAPRQERLKRLTARDQMSASLAEKIMDTQASDTERRQHASLILDNSGTVEKLQSQIQNLITLKGWNFR